MGSFKSFLGANDLDRNEYGSVTDFIDSNLSESEVEDLHHKTAMSEIWTLKNHVAYQIDRKKYHGDPITLDQLEFVEKELGRILKPYP